MGQNRNDRNNGNLRRVNSIEVLKADWFIPDENYNEIPKPPPYSSPGIVTLEQWSQPASRT